MPSARSIEAALRRPPTGAVHLVPFIPVGYGGFDVTAAAVRAVAEAGASVIELGIPFSDPIADGPVIQAAYDDALRRGTSVANVFDVVRGLRPDVPPMLAMVSYSIVFRAGVEQFCRQASAAGLCGVLCPDLPPPEAESFCRIAVAAGLEAVLLVAPTTPPQRRDLIGRAGGGFVYYLSVAGTTGERSALPPTLAEGVADMKSRTALPVCVGFGIGRNKQVQGLRGVAEGAIVGSAYVRRMQEALPHGARRVAEACADLTRDLLS